MPAALNFHIHLLQTHFSNLSRRKHSDGIYKDIRDPEPRRSIPRRLAHGLKKAICRLTSPLRHRTMDTKPDSNAQDGCIQAVTSLFPDICLEYLDTLAVPLLYNSEAVINQIIDLVEAGTSYTRRPQVKILKRKRDDDDDEDDDEDEVSDAKRKYASPSRAETSLTNRQMMTV